MTSVKRETNFAAAFIDRYYMLGMIIIAPLIIWLNYHAKAMQGIIPYYQDFKRIILGGFDPRAGLQGVPTFPMWGYGWVFLITENRVVLLAFQNLLGIFCVWFFVRYLETSQHLSDRPLRTVKIVVALSLPWYAFHSVLWPYSIAVSLFLLSFVLLVGSLNSEKGCLGRIALSGSLFGIMLNFRSDYYLMPAGFVTIVLVFTKLKNRSIIKSALWLIAVYAMLIPWAAYTRHATGHSLLTSTNSGQVFVTGLGNLPDNKWGITPSDEDPVVHALIEEHFGKARSPLVYETDQYLKEVFLNMVMSDPLEYLRKCAYAFKLVLLGGCYAGEFYESPECHPRCRERLKGILEIRKNITELLAHPASFVRAKREIFRPRILLNGFSFFMGVVIVMGSIVMLPVTSMRALSTRNVFLLLMISSLLYQMAINVFGFNMRAYTSNMFFLHIIHLSIGLQVVRDVLTDGRKASEAR